MNRAILRPREYHQLKSMCFRGFAEVTVASAFLGVLGLSLQPLIRSDVKASVSESVVHSFLRLIITPAIQSVSQSVSQSVIHLSSHSTLLIHSTNAARHPN